ncbi:hemagglutinin repeat-containing protein [Pseudomonas gingeri]|uniref:hemagglutinin repeat-containing protein n=1 Tax=Pseudomonas gingeri TaxID=117681 RepID=UPI0015A092B6|nr:hemagglutinin repeat-containing protein [Pseudomonas gingeri]
MDVRQFAFLAGQPSAALKNREHFWGLPKRGLAFILANAMFWQPLLAQADGIVVSAPGTTLGQAGNGVPIVNIAAPNAQGLSHNQFSDYNVGANGVILNNATARTQSTQLGGIILGNQNLNGTAANVILNEVTGASPSQLRGYTEVAGQSAHVIVANPYGISCNGCGFINTPQATLTTGKAVITNGQVTGYQVDRGSVSIDGAGLNASNIDQFEIITRSAKLNAEINAKKLAIIAGANDIDAKTLKATARAANPADAPQLAIDSSVLGGMYAGAIKLVGTEAGVGVKLDGKMVASGGDIQLDANGHLSMVETGASGAIDVKAASLEAQGPVYAGTTLDVKTQGDLTSQNNLAAKDHIALTSGGQLTNNGIVEAGINADKTRNALADVSITAQNVTNTGKSVIASRDLIVTAAQALNNQGGTLSGQRQTRVTAATLDNTQGQLTGDLGLSIDLSGALDNHAGMLGSGKALNLTAASLDNRAAGTVLAADGSLTATLSGAFDNREQGKLRATSGIDLGAGSLDNRGGSVVGKDQLTLRSASADNRGGLIQADKDLKLQVAQLDNRDKGNLIGKAAVDYDGTRLDNGGGLISAVGPLTLKALVIENTKGRIASQDNLSATVDTLNQQGGALVAQGSLLLTAKDLDNRNGGTVASTRALTLNIDRIDNRAGEVSSTDSSVTVSGQRLDNSDGGKLLTETDLGLTVAQLINQNEGRLFAKGTTRLTGSSLDNTGGNVSGLKGLDIRLDAALLNNTGLLSSEGGLTLNAASLDNTGGKLGSAGALSITSLGALLNQGGSILTDSGLVISSASLDNSQQGLINGTGATRLTTGTLDNRQGGRLTSNDNLDLNATQVSNQSGRIASDKALTASVTGLDQQGGELFSKTRLDLDLNNGQLNNQKGLINGPILVLKNLNGVANQNGEISSAQAFTLTAQSLDNSGGKLLSNQGLTLNINQALNNFNGTLSAASLYSRSDSLDNSHGWISSRGAVDLGITNVFINQNGTLIGDGALLLTANSLDNSNGAVLGKADVTANISTLNNQNGQLIATGALNLTGSSLDNRLGGLVGATKALKLNVGDIDNRGGELSSAADISLIGSGLNNSDSGKVLAETTLGLTVTQVLNRNLGLLKGNTGVTLDGQTLDNSAGQLISRQDARLTLSGDLNNTQGLVSSEGQLEVAGANLSNSGGNLSSAGPLSVNASGSLGNQAGHLVSDSTINLTSTSLDNTQQGVISGKGMLAIGTGAFDNSTGSLTSADGLSLAAKQVTNQNGGRIGSEKALNVSVFGLDQQGGKLFSNTSLNLSMNRGQLNNQNGLINAPSLVLDNLGDVNNQGGEISSAQAFSVIADNLDNSNGKLLSNQALTLRMNQALTNLKGQIAAAALYVQAASVDNSGGILTSRGDLSLSATGQLTNQNQGLINAAQALTIASGNLNNQGGLLLGVSGITLGAMALNNSGNGLINSQSGLTINAMSLDSSTGGEVSAKGDIDLNLGALTQNGGRLLGNQAINIDLADGDFDNRNGLLSANGPLTLNRLRDLNNRSGEVSSIQTFVLNTRALDNSGGKLISNNQLGVSGETLVNQSGLISGWQGLVVTGGSLDNRNGTLSSRSGNLDVSVTDALLNSQGGALASQKVLTVNAGSLDNSAGFLSSGAGQQLTVNGLLSNTQGGSIDSGAALTLNAMALSNSGTINAQQGLNFTGTTLDNSGGTLSGNGAVNLDLLGALTNTNGKLSSGGPLVISRSSQINNQGGQLVSQGLLSVLTGGLDNRNRGTVAANDVLTLTASGAVQNSTDGLIYSQNSDVNLTAASLANGKGVVQSQGALNLAIAGDIDNQSGKLTAQNGDLTVTAANLDNRGGTLASIKGALEARIVGVLKNGYDLNNNRQGGITQAQRLNLIALGGIDNYGGRIAAQTGDAVITTADFDNRNGGLYAKGLVKVSGNNFDNSGDNDGQIAGQQIDLSLNGALNNRLGIIESDSTLSVRAASLDNQTGQLRALGTSGKTDFQIGGLFDNRNGKMETANSDLTVNAGGFQNLGGSLLHVGNGTFDIATANILNAGGSLVTRGGLTLTADNWTNSSVIQAGRLTVNVNTLNQTAGGQLLASTSLTGNGGNWNNDGLIASDGTANLNLSGSYGGNGRLSSLGTLGLTAASVNLGANGSIAGGGDTTINVGGQLNNYGRLTSAAGMTVNAGGISNYGTLGSSQKLSLNTPTLLNDQGLIFSGADMDIKVNDFTNQNAALYSLGSLSVSGVQGGKANKVINFSSSIQVDGDFSLASAVFENTRKATVGKEKLLSGDITVECADGDCYTLRYYVDESYVSESTFEGQAATVSVAGNLTGDVGRFTNFASSVAVGKNLRMNADSFENQSVSSGAFTRSRVYMAGSYGKDDATNDLFYHLAYINNGISPNGDGAMFAYADRNSRYQHQYTGVTADSDGGGGGAPTVMERRFQTLTRWWNSQFGVGPDVALPSLIASYSLMSDVKQYQTSSSVASVIQAGQLVEINAKNSIQNGDLKSLTAFSAQSRSKQDTEVKPNLSTTEVHMNAQLPPDLAQRQVNPTLLPNFTLPSGQNGLFRLSGQGGTQQQAAQANIGSQGWSMRGAIVGTAQHQQSQVDVQARNPEINDISRAIASDRQLTQTARQATGSDVGASTINVNVPADIGGGAIQLPGNTVGSQPSSGQSLVRVQGLPDLLVKSNPQKYLIETNPVLTDLKQFMSSDYLLAGLGYKPDESAKRLGDGFYEQKLIQQAVVARTGQRFIDGQTSDENLFKYLMDNAISSKQQLGLSMGVTLTSQQVAALTHDIVWMEKQVVNGEEVLVPVLYLAQATNRLAPNGALIQGSDITLIAGENLENSGTLRASNNLKASADNDLVNSGLIESGNRLDLLAGNSIVNNSGGIIAGRDVSLTATRADVLNQRDISHFDSSFAQDSRHRDVLGSSARIEASNDLSISAGRDISNSASVLSSGSDMKLSAGRDVNVNALVERTMNAQGDHYLNQQITQHEAVVTAGRDLSVSAGRDISAIASRIESKRDMALASDGDIRIESAANESQFVSRGRSTLETRSVSQQSSELKAGGKISVDSGKDLDVVASRIKAGGDIALDAAQDMTIASAKDESSYYYYKKSSGSFGQSSSKQVESYDSRNVASVIDAGHDLTVNANKAADGSVSINGGRDVSVIGSQLKAGNDLVLAATNDVAVLSGVEEHGSYSKKTSSGFLGLTKSGKSQLKTSATQIGSELDAGNDVVVASGNDVRLRASQMAAGNDVELRAGLVNKAGDINLVSANDTAYSRTEEYKKKAGLSVSGGFISISSAKEAGREAQSSTSVGSQVTADRDATLQAERDINLSGSGIKAGRNVSLDAGRDVNVVSAQNSSAEQDWKKSKQVGIGVSSDDNGVSLFAGVDRTKEKNRLEQQTAAASQISAGQDLAITAKRDINQIGSDLKASNDIDLTAGRNINIDAARETQLTEQQRESERNGLGVTLSHNFGNTKNAVNGAGKGEDATSKGSSTLKGVDAVSQFLAGPTADTKLGNSKQSSSQVVIEQSNRSSTLDAGNDLKLQAGNDITVKGGQLQAGRDINVKGRDVTLDVAKGSVSQESTQHESWGGIHGGTSGGFKIGIGGSNGVATEDGVQGSSTSTQVAAGRDVNLDASHDLNLIGTQAKAGRDITLNAGNDLNIRSAQNENSSESNRHNGGGEVGLVFGSEGVGVYASVNTGKGDLDREGKRQQEAYLYAGERLGFASGRDTNVAGATLRGDEVVGRVGGDLNVSSVVDTGKVKGREFDISVTATIGPGAGVSGSVGYGETTGKTNWVGQQTSITGKDKVDIRTENHTQLDGALVAADNGNLKLDTGTLGFSDIAGEDKEHGYYLNVGGSYSKGGGNAQDSSQVGKGKQGETGWSVNGWQYDKEREQVVRATVGTGDIVVRNDAGTEISSTVGLNRDVDKSYEVTKDKESRTDLYVTSSSVDAALAPKSAFEQWKKNVALYGENSENAAISLIDLLMVTAMLPGGMVDGNGMEDAVFYMKARDERQKLMSSDPVKRAEVLRTLLAAANVDYDKNTEALVSRLTEMSGADLKGALQAIQLLADLNRQEKLDILYFGPLAPLALGAVSALGAALAAASTPENMERMRAAANAVASAAAKGGRSAVEQARISIGIWELLIGTHFPGQLLNDENQKLVNPIIDLQGQNPTSGGFGVDGQPSTSTNTGGSQIVDPKGSVYTTPVSDLPSPGNVYNSDGSKITYGEHAKIRSTEGRPVGSVVNDIQTARPSDILVQDDGRWVIKGGNGRIHVLESNGEVVTSFLNPNANTNSRIQKGEWARASQDELKRFESQFSDYVKW